MIKWSNISWKKKTKIHVKTHKIIVFKAFSLGFLLILLCNRRPVATGYNWLLTNWSISVAVRSSCGLFPVHRTGPANTSHVPHVFAYAKEAKRGTSCPILAGHGGLTLEVAPDSLDLCKHFKLN